MKREVNINPQQSERAGKSRNSNKKNDYKTYTDDINDSRIITDPFGSWTGVVEDDYFDKPIQDVDDL